MSSPLEIIGSRRPQAVFSSSFSKMARSFFQVPASQLELVGLLDERGVAHEGDDLKIAPDQLFGLRQILLQARGHLVQVGEDPVQVLVLVDELCGGLLPDTRNSRRLSDGSPRSAASTGYLAGVTPVRSKMPASS